MAEENNKITELQEKLAALERRQEYFQKDIETLRQQIKELSMDQPNLANKNTVNTSSPVLQPKPVSVATPEHKTVSPPPIKPVQPANKPPSKSDLEKFIGENLISKIGIAITIIGVAIGAKYSIEHQLINPLTRIILGYIVGAGLLFFSIRLKNNYSSYSAVLVSGAMAIFYFITYAAYSFYGFYGITGAFLIMLVITAATVYAAIKYNLQVIAHIGLVGAYAVPFLLSEGSGRVHILFSYMAIINVGILFIAFKKYWKPLYYSAFIVTWLIFFSWLMLQFQHEIHLQLSLTFLSIFFITFYSIFLVYKLLRQEKFKIDDIALLLTNSFLFYAAGYYILDAESSTKHLQGIFTLLNAVIHLVMCVIIYRQKLADRNLFYFVAGLVLVFITIAIPVELNGSWVTLLWACEAALLFWIGRTKKVTAYEVLAYPLMLLAFSSLIQDWLVKYNINGSLQSFTPFLNIHFLTSLIFSASFTFINIILVKYPHDNAALKKKDGNIMARFAIPAILIMVVYFTFRMEIAQYFDRRFYAAMDTANRENFTHYAILDLKNLWLVNFTLGFFLALNFLNISRIRNRALGHANILLNVLAVVLFLLQGLYTLSELRDDFYNTAYTPGAMSVWLRYISYVLVALLFIYTFKYLKQAFMQPVTVSKKRTLDLFFHLSVLWIITSELLNWMHLSDFEQSYKLGLSILWGLYSLMLIGLGIYRKKKHLRVAAIILFGATLLKLFLYDIASLNTIAKTIVFVSLGVLLLIISFLYNKYRAVILNESIEKKVNISADDKPAPDL